MINKVDRALSYIANTNDPKGLLAMIRNASAIGEHDVVHAAEYKLFTVMPSQSPGTFEHDVWSTIHALEYALTDERGRTTRLARTRQKIARVGEFQTVVDLIMNEKPAEGFKMLIERQMHDLTFEAVALRHKHLFNNDHLTAATARLQEHKL